MLNIKDANPQSMIESLSKTFDAFVQMMDEASSRIYDERRKSLIGYLIRDSYMFNNMVKNEFTTYLGSKSLINIFKVKGFISLLKNLYSLSMNLYLNVYKFIVDIMYLFRTKNSYMQLKYNDKIIFQNSIGIYGFKKKEKSTRYAKRILSKRFVEYFSQIMFEYGDRINIILKGFRKPYKRSIRHLISNLQFRLDNRYHKHSNYYKLLLRKKALALNYMVDGRAYLETNGQRLTEREVFYDKVRSRLYSFLYIKCFYFSSFQFGGIRLRFKKKIPNKYY